MEAHEARDRFDELINRVHRKGETIVIELSGEPAAAIIPIELFQRLIAAREARFAVIDRLQERLPDVPEDEVIEDATQAIGSVRSAR